MKDATGVVDERLGEAGTSREHIRGSALLLVGRGVSLCLNLLTQVVTVRYLSKLDYGALSYALMMVTLGANLNVLSLDRSLARFLPIYAERGDLRRLAGSLLLALGTILGMGLALVLLTLAGRDLMTRSVTSDPLAVGLLLTMIALVPFGAVDRVLEALLAVFAGARAIFFRRHLLTPGVRLGAVVGVVVTGGSVRSLAVAHVVAGVIGVAAYAVFLRRALLDRGVLRSLPLRAQPPVRELVVYTLPLLVADLAVVLRNSVVVIFVQYWHGADAVAELRAVLPVAQLNELVYANFSFLFIPAASRLFARNRRDLVGDLYNQTAIWVTVLTFPIFALTFLLADPLAVQLFGARYATSGPILAALACGSFFGAAVGFNVKTIRVFGRMRNAVIADVLASIAALVLNLVLVPSYGALGGAVATAVAAVIHGLLYQWGLWLATGISPFDRTYARVYVVVGAGALALLLSRLFWTPSLPLGVPLAAAVSLLVLRLSRESLRLGGTFPELRRIPFVRWLAPPDVRDRGTRG